MPTQRLRTPSEIANKLTPEQIAALLDPTADHGEYTTQLGKRKQALVVAREHTELGVEVAALFFVCECCCGQARFVEAHVAAAWGTDAPLHVCGSCLQTRFDSAGHQFPPTVGELRCALGGLADHLPAHQVPAVRFLIQSDYLRELLRVDDRRARGDWAADSTTPVVPPQRPHPWNALPKERDLVVFEIEDRASVELHGALHLGRFVRWLKDGRTETYEPSQVTRWRFATAADAPSFSCACIECGGVAVNGSVLVHDVGCPHYTCEKCSEPAGHHDPLCPHN